MVGEAGLEPAKAKPADLQSAPFAARDIPPPRGFTPTQEKAPREHGANPWGAYGDSAPDCQPKKPGSGPLSKVTMACSLRPARFCDTQAG